jgi:hypothetical protein
LTRFNSVPLEESIGVDASKLDMNRHMITHPRSPRSRKLLVAAVRNVKAGAHNTSEMG